MADFTAKAPSEPNKIGGYLHERSHIPASPRPDWAGLAKRNIGLILGIIFALGAEALAFQIRASWSDHREWVVPATTPFWVLAGLALGHLLARGRWKALGPFVFFFVFTAAFVVASYWRGQLTAGEDRGRNALTIMAAMTVVCSIACLLGALILTEVRNPTRAPAPEE